MKAKAKEPQPKFEKSPEDRKNLRILLGSVSATALLAAGLSVEAARDRAERPDFDADKTGVLVSKKYIPEVTTMAGKAPLTLDEEYKLYVAQEQPAGKATKYTIDDENTVVFVISVPEERYAQESVGEEIVLTEKEAEMAEPIYADAVEENSLN